MRIDSPTSVRPPADLAARFTFWRLVAFDLTKASPPGSSDAEDGTNGAHKGVAYGTERGFTAAFELVVTPAVCALFGHFLDGWLGTGRIFTLGFAIFVSCYVVWKLWYQYNNEMERLDAERRGTPSAAATASAPATSSTAGTR